MGTEGGGAQGRPGRDLEEIEDLLADVLVLDGGAPLLQLVGVDAEGGLPVGPLHGRRRQDLCQRDRLPPALRPENLPQRGRWRPQTRRN